MKIKQIHGGSCLKLKKEKEKKENALQAFKGSHHL